MIDRADPSATHNHRAVIVARPGHLRQGLHALLSTAPGLDQVEQADSSLAGLANIAPPDLALLDFDRPLAESLALVRRIKATWPQARCLVLVDNERQQAAARTAGADLILRKAVRPDRLLAIVADCLNPSH